MWHGHAQQRVPRGAPLSRIRRILTLRARPVQHSRHIVMLLLICNAMSRCQTDWLPLAALFPV